MYEQDGSAPSSVRNYEKRQNRHRQLYWRALLPIAVLLIASYATGYLQEGLLLAGLGVLVVMLIMVREIIDVLGYLGFLQRTAADEREAMRRELKEIKERLAGSDRE